MPYQINDDPLLHEGHPFDCLWLLLWLPFWLVSLTYFCFVGSVFKLECQACHPACIFIYTVAFHIPCHTCCQAHGCAVFAATHLDSCGRLCTATKQQFLSSPAALCLRRLLWKILYSHLGASKYTVYRRNKRSLHCCCCCCCCFCHCCCIALGTSIFGHTHLDSCGRFCTTTKQQQRQQRQQPTTANHRG
jgi:hypothetical protein